MYREGTIGNASGRAICSECFKPVSKGKCFKMPDIYFGHKVVKSIHLDCALKAIEKEISGLKEKEKEVKRCLVRGINEVMR